MIIEGWKYYEHAAIPALPPHRKINTDPIKNGSIWQIEGGTPLLARWHSDWDCGYETNWWFCIKDTPFDITALKSKRRYEITKGNKNFVVKEINPTDYSEELYKVAIAAWETYPDSYRPNVSRESFIESTKRWDSYKIYGAFSLDDTLCGYACILQSDKYINFVSLKVMPEKEKQAINAAIVYKILIDHDDFLGSGGYICDGARSVLHETAFQDYLEKYFDFRKAYCKLHIVYRPCLKLIIKIFYPLRGIFRKMKSLSFARKANVLLRMEEINRGNH